MSQKLKPATTAEKQKRKRKRKKKTEHTLTRALTHIRLLEANPGKLAALDELLAVYLPLCQQYTTLFCTQEESPDKYTDPVFETELSDRLHRVAIQQAAGIAKSWRSNREAAYQAYLTEAAAYAATQEQAKTERKRSSLKRKEPTWTEWELPVLRAPVMQANANVVVVEKSEDSTFDYWVRISTVDKRKPLWVPVKLAAYHKQVLAGKTLNTSPILHKRKGLWWLTLSFDEDVPLQTEGGAPRVGIDVGITNFVTTSTGKRYGTFVGKLARAHKRDREKRRRKDKLRACLKKTGVPEEKLPSKSSTSGQRLGRRVRQQINRAINQALEDHPHARIIYEDLSVASMRFKARAMNAYLYASNLGHLPKQLAWATAKRGMAAHTVRAAYSSQECPVCHYVDRKNRPNQQTFCCQVCGFTDHADRKAAGTLATRWGDKELAACRDLKQVKALLMQRHEEWKQANPQRIGVSDPLVQLSLWPPPEEFLDSSHE